MFLLLDKLCSQIQTLIEVHYKNGKEIISLKDERLHLYFVPSTSICNLPFVGKLREN